MGGAPDRQLGSPGFDPCTEHYSSILHNLDSWPPSQLSVSLPSVPQSLGPLGQDTGDYGVLGACAGPQGLTPSTHSDLSYSNNSSCPSPGLLLNNLGCPNPDLLPDSLLVTNLGSTVGSALDRQSSNPGIDPCLGHHLSILPGLGSWPPGQLSVSLPPVPLGLSPLGQDAEGYASIYIPPPPPSATQQQLCNLRHPVPPPKRRRLNPPGEQGDTGHSPRSQCPFGDSALRARKEEHDRTGVG